MTTEQQLIEAFDAAHGYEPSPDLWTRVVHSIEEDHRHRRRVWRTGLGIGAVALAAVAVLALGWSTEPGPLGSRPRFDWRLIEAVEFAVLAVLVLTLGPAIRRFGRGYVEDIVRPPAGTRLLVLLDVAYYLVFSGFMLVTVRFEAPRSFRLYDAGDQLEEVAIRIGGLLLIMGLLHAATLMVLPLIGLVYNSNRTGRRLPRWIAVGLVLGGVAAAVAVLPMLVGLLLSGIGG